MITNTREKGHPNKQEGSRSTTDDHKALPFTSSRLWSGLKNPRIVRVSRAFGGKDRHSKVSTIRGLRDRRVRLSVTTAIQLYDLQDRLGLNQPSKVVDWLLNAAQHEIDKLPPLQFPPGNFVQFPQSLATLHEATLAEAPEDVNEHGPRHLSSFPNKAKVEDLATFAASNFWNSGPSQSFQQRSVEEKELAVEKSNIIQGNEVVNAQALSHDPLPRTGHSLVPAGLLSNAMAYTSYYHWEASNPCLSQFGIHSSQVEAPPMLIPSSRSLLAPESQIVFCTPPGVIPSVFQSYVATPTEFDAKQFNHLQMVSSASQNLPSNSVRNLKLDGPETRPFH